MNKKRVIAKSILLGLIILFAFEFVGANTIESSTMVFEGTLSYDSGTGAYTGTIDATEGDYYVGGGGGESISTTGGFDVYAKEGGTAYVQGTGSYAIGSDHDAYSSSGPWGTWYDPDVADWNKYELELTVDHWYLRYKDTDESPMSGTIDWATMFAAEIDLGTQNGGHDGSKIYGGGAQAWDWDCGWGVEVIPLEFSGFEVTVTDLSGNNYRVNLSSAHIGKTLNVVPFSLGGVGDATAEWLTTNKYVGSSSVHLETTATGIRSTMSFDPLPAAIDDITSLSFMYNHVSDTGWAGPRIGILINNGEGYHLAVSGAVVTSVGTWVRADGVTGEQITTTGTSGNVWWYGTCTDAQCSSYTQVGGPVSFADIKTNLDGNVEAISIYMGIVGQGAGIGEAYIDNVKVNGVTYYGNIQDAIDSATSGDTINVGDGTYTENLAINKGVRLLGAGRDVVTVTGTHTITTNNVVIDGFKLQGTGSTVVTIDDTIAVSGGTISNNKITGGYDGIRLGTGGVSHGGVRFIEIKGNIITANTKKGIRFYSGADYMTHGVGDITISDNEITSNGDSGISTYGDGPNTITGNTVSGNAGNGISIKYDNGDVVSGNTVTGNTAMGVNMHQVTGSSVENNSISGHVSDEVVTTFWGTPITAGKGSAIYIHEDSHNNTVRLNTLTNNKIGILMSRESVSNDPSGNSINNNKITGNTVYGILNALVSPPAPVNAENNYWGSLDGPGGSGPGNGNNVTENVDYSPWLGLPVGSVPMTYGVDNTSSIQEIINLANPGDTIYVSDGTYNGNLVINKAITLKGTGYSSTTIIDCGGAGTGITITANNAVVSGFKIINCDNGIDIQGKSNSIINNSFNFNVNGIKVSEAWHNKINLNVIEGNTKFGINNTDDSFVNATLNYWGSCDGPGGIGNGNGNNVSIMVDFNPWIGVCITNKTNVTCKYETDNITLSVNISSSLEISVWISYTINGTNYNATVTNPVGNIYSYILKSNQLIGGMNVTWNYYVNDSLGNLYNNSWKTFYVRNRTSLIVNPPEPDGLNNWYITEPLFSLVKDVNGTNVYYQWDSNDVFLYVDPFGLENIPNPPKETAGTLGLNWWADFMACGNEPEQTQMFHIDLTDPLITNLQPANNSIVYNNLRPNISAYLDERYGSNSGINLSSVIMKLDGNIVSANINPLNSSLHVNVWNISDLSLGKHNVAVNATDNSGRNSELTWFFAINESPQFMMFVNSPQDGIYGNKRISFNITLSANVKVLEYINYNDSRPRWSKLCGDCSEYGNRSKRTKTLNEGNNSIRIRATDSFGTVKEENISLFIDSKPPVIAKTLPERNKVTNGTGFYIKYTENNLQKIELFWNGNKTLNCIAGINQECRTDVNLSAYDGNFIDYYFNVTDLVRTVESRITKVKVDTTAPELTVNSPENNTNHSSRVPFNITVSEDVLLEYYDKLDPSPRWRRLCSNCDDYGNSRKKLKYFKKGTHDLLIIATDKAGQVDVEERGFMVS